MREQLSDYHVTVTFLVHETTRINALDLADQAAEHGVDGVVNFIDGGYIHNHWISAAKEVYQ